MKILSIDVGIKNLSYCVFSIIDGNVSVIDWQNVTVIEGSTKKMGIEETVEHVLRTLSEVFPENHDDRFVAETILIENQPMLKNGLMKTISVVIYSYFKMLSLHMGCIESVKFVSAMNKLKCKKGLSIEGSRDSYKTRKEMGVKIAHLYLEKVCPDKIEWFNAQKKKDDLADAMCQGIHYIENKLKLEI